MPTLNKLTNIAMAKSRVTKQVFNDDGSSKTPCVSACLCHLGIPTESFDRTSNPIDKSMTTREKYENVNIWMNVLEDHNIHIEDVEGMGIKVDLDKNLVNGVKTVSKVRNKLKELSGKKEDLFLLHCIQKHNAHLMMVNGKGQKVIDTAHGMKWKVLRVFKVNKS